MAAVNPFKNQFETILAQIENNSYSDDLDLSRQGINDDQVEALVKALSKNKNVQTLSLEENEISDRGAIALANTLLQPAPLRSLNLRVNDIGNIGIAALAKALEKNTTLEYLNLSVNEVEKEGAMEMLKALEYNKTLCTLCLAGNSLQKNFVLDQIEAALSHNKKAAILARREVAAMNFSVSYSIDPQELSFDRELNQGTFGIVYQGSWRGTKVATKKLLPNGFSAKAFKAESQTMARLRSPHIVQFYGYCLSPLYCLVMEYMPAGSLFNVLHSKQNLPWSIRMRIALDIAKGLAFLHHEKLVHRDIKSLNVLLGEHLNAKLTGFGLAKDEDEIKIAAAESQIGMLAWMAPELLKAKVAYTAKADVYSLGITFWELASRKVPFSDAKSPEAIQNRIIQGEPEVIPEDCPAKLASVIEACCETDPDNRPGADEVALYLDCNKEEDIKLFLWRYRMQQSLAVPSYSNILGSCASAQETKGAQPKSVA